MSKKDRRSDSKPMTDTMQLEDPVQAFEPVSDSQPEEFIPAEHDENTIDIIDAEENQPEQYAKAEKALGIVTGVLSCLLIIGSLVFWWYFASRITACPIAVDKYQLYGGMLICSAIVTLCFTVGQAIRRTPVSAESWMINMCVSGVITAIIMAIYNFGILGSPFAMDEALTILCFSISGCAFPAAIFSIVYWLVNRFINWVRQTASRDRNTVYSDVLRQCEGRF